VTSNEPKSGSFEAEAAQQLRSILEDIDAGSLSASAVQRAYLAGAADVLGSLAAQPLTLGQTSV
jgi:hypothetical protein